MMKNDGALGKLLDLILQKVERIKSKLNVIEECLDTVIKIAANHLAHDVATEQQRETKS